MLRLLIGLQIFHVAFLWLHDWAPLGALNDVKAIRAADPPGKLIRITLAQAVPYTVGLLFSLKDLGRSFPGWLWWWLWISYGLLFVGELRAWWAPYLLRPEPDRAQRYAALFGKTHAFLPARNGIRPNTLHVLLHAATVATLATLAALALAPPHP